MTFRKKTAFVTVSAMIFAWVAAIIIALRTLHSHTKEEGFLSNPIGLRITHVYTEGPPVRIAVENDIKLPWDPLGVRLDGRKGARSVTWTDDINDADIYLGDAIDAWMHAERLEVVAPMQDIEWCLTIHAEFASTLRPPPMSLRELIRETDTWPTIVFVRPDSLSEAKAIILAKRAWVAATAAHGGQSYEDANRTGRVRVLRTPDNGNDSCLLYMAWTTHPKSDSLSYVSPATETSSVVLAVAPEMTIRAFDDGTRLLSCGATFLVVGSSYKSVVGVKSVSDTITQEILGKSVRNASEAALLERVGARLTKKCSEHAVNVIKRRLHLVTTRSPYGLSTVPIREQFSERPEVKQNMTSPNVELVPFQLPVMWADYPYRDPTQGIAIPENGGAVHRLCLATDHIQGVLLRRGDRVYYKHKLYVMTQSQIGGRAILTRPLILPVVDTVIRNVPFTPAENGVILFARVTDCVLLKGVKIDDQVIILTNGILPVQGDVDAVDSNDCLIRVRMPTERLEAASVPPTDKNLRMLREERDWLHPLARCSGDENVPTRTMCERDIVDSTPEEDGGSTTQSVWDRPCEHDVHCPFFDARTGRGGCLGGGMCEVPIGVRRVGFRHVDPERSKPSLCWNSHSTPCDHPVFGHLG